MDEHNHQRTAIDIQEHWNNIAETYTTDPRGTMPDVHLRKLEFAAICQWIDRDDSVLDLGCGNGFMTLQLAQKITGPVVGIDFAKKMIDSAQHLLRETKPELRTRVRFAVDDIVHPQITGQFRKVISQRCLINLPSQHDQITALQKIHGLLEDGGIALLSEDTLQGYNTINALRASLQMENMAKRWHNYLFDEELLVQDPVQSLFDTVTICDFSSTYYLISRVVNIAYARRRQEGVEFYPELDVIASQLPAVGNFGLLRLIVLRKK